MQRIIFIASLIFIFIVGIAGVFLFVAQTNYREVQSIRSIDFTNFTYPGKTFGEYETPYPEQEFALRNREYGDWRYGLTMERTIYGDATGDGEEEAILVFSQNTDGSAANHSVYIYTLENKQPKLLWAFMTGDRANGGLRRVSAEGGRLVVELFGKETRIEEESASYTTEFSGLCCPESFTLTHYQWIEGRFQQVGEMDVQPNPAASSDCPTCLPNGN